MPVPAVKSAGRLVYSMGSMKATCAAIITPPTLNLYSRSSSLITAHSVTSLPVPAVVGTATRGGMRLVSGFFPGAHS